MPSTGGRTITRTRVLQKLRLAPSYRLILVTAPAGYGKTTAVASYLSSSGLPYAWVSLDDEDNDPVTFWRYLTAAVAGAFRDRGVSFTDQSFSRALAESDAVAGWLASALSGVSAPAVLVLDDAHVIRSAALKKSLSYFIRRLPANICVMLLSRRELDLEFAVMASKAQVMKIGRDMLAFDREEVAAFYASKGISLTAGQVSTVADHTEGWAAGLVLAALAMAEQADVPEAIRHITRDHHVDRVLDEEVFAKWPANVQEFLVHTAFLDRLSGPLCQAVTGLAQSEEILHSLAEWNSFVIQLGQDNTWFRYHSLFAAFLSARLDREDHQLVIALRRNAGRWYLEHGFIREGISALIAGEDYQGAASALFPEAAIAMSHAGDYALVCRWMADLPEQYYRDDVGLCSLYAWSLISDRQLQSGQEWLEKTIAAYRRAAGQYASPAADAYYRVLSILAEFELARLRLDAAGAATSLAEACEAGPSGKILPGELNTCQPSMLSTYTGFYGRLRMIEQAYLPVAERLPLVFGNEAVCLSVMQAEVAYERGRLDECEAILLRDMETIIGLDMPGAIVPCFATLAKVGMARGDIAAAQAMIADGRARLGGQNRAFWNRVFDLIAAELLLMAGNASDAGEYLDLDRVSVSDDITPIREFEHLVYARYLRQVGRLDEAVFLLHRLKYFSQAERRLYGEIKTLCLLAVTESQRRNLAHALSALDGALRLAHEDEYARSFLDEGSAMVELLKRYLSRGQGANRDTDEYAQHLLSLPEAAVPRNGPASVSLTPREWDVLRLLAAERTNEEIAAELGMGVRTVKYHNSNLFRKLSARTRLDAVYRARDAGLL